MPEDERLAIARWVSFFPYFPLFRPPLSWSHDWSQTIGDVEENKFLNPLLGIFYPEASCEAERLAISNRTSFKSLFFVLFYPEAFREADRLATSKRTSFKSLFVLFYHEAFREAERLAISKRSSILPALFVLFYPETFSEAVRMDIVKRTCFVFSLSAPYYQAMTDAERLAISKRAWVELTRFVLFYPEAFPEAKRLVAAKRTCFPLPQFVLFYSVAKRLAILNRTTHFRICSILPWSHASGGGIDDIKEDKKRFSPECW